VNLPFIYDGRGIVNAPEPVSFATEVFAVVAQKACGVQKIGPQLRHGAKFKVQSDGISKPFTPSRAIARA
jgi:hypothetical protein